MSLFKTRFLWNGKKKVTILSAINSHEEGGLTIIDIESTIRVLSRSKTCLENIKRVQFTSNKCAWKLYLKHLYLKMWFSCYTVAGIITKLMTFRFNHCSIVKKYFRRHLQQMRTGWRLIIALLTSEYHGKTPFVCSFLFFILVVDFISLIGFFLLSYLFKLQRNVNNSAPKPHKMAVC